MQNNIHAVDIIIAVHFYLKHYVSLRDKKQNKTQNSQLNTFPAFPL